MSTFAAHPSVGRLNIRNKMIIIILILLAFPFIAHSQTDFSDDDLQSGIVEKRFNSSIHELRLNSIMLESMKSYLKKKVFGEYKYFTGYIFDFSSDYYDRYPWFINGNKHSKLIISVFSSQKSLRILTYETLYNYNADNYTNIYQPIYFYSNEYVNVNTNNIYEYILQSINSRYSKYVISKTNETTIMSDLNDLMAGDLLSIYLTNVLILDGNISNHNLYELQPMNRNNFTKYIEYLRGKYIDEDKVQRRIMIPAYLISEENLNGVYIKNITVSPKEATENILAVYDGYVNNDENMNYNYAWIPKKINQQIIMNIHLKNKLKVNNLLIHYYMKDKLTELKNDISVIIGNSNNKIVITNAKQYEGCDLYTNTTAFIEINNKQEIDEMSIVFSKNMKNICINEIEINK